MIRFLDLFISLTGFILLLPFFLIISAIILIDSKGGIFYRQIRVGKNGKDFNLVKFRTMRINSDRAGGLTIGARDSRITRFGYWLRRYKADELPQLLNVISGEMSLVGPRPEIRKYTDQYDEEQRKVLSVKPGITDYASIEYADENALLGRSQDPERTYIDEVMPAKIRLNMRYINHQTTGEYLKIITLTIKRLLR
jgi:lipopolysaccharide/colanic/teichoic acid biosynthesis glycosyltransferase